ncbi:hypothetical protein BGZ58_006423 [Dissophora ornata]|nr:hypothetical protein BGZ58_006423 [Dissophora ornata]
MFRLVNKRLAANRELENLKQEFNQCSLPIEFVYRIVVSCVDEIMARGLNHPFILKNPYPASVVAAMITLMADPERRDLFSLKCMRIDTVAGVMLAVLKNLREAIVPMEIQEDLTSGKYSDFTVVAGLSSTNSGSSSPTSSSQSTNKINTVNSLLNHPNFPSVNRALLMELLNLSLAILNRSSFNRVKPDMLASILGPHIFATQHATILQHTPQQAYSFGWGIALVNDIKRCSKMFYVLLGGYRREILCGPDEWEFDQVPTSGVPLSRSSSGGQATIRGGMGGAGIDQSVPQLRVITDVNSPPISLSRYGMTRKVSTTLSESIRAVAAQEAKQWKVNRSNSGSKGLAALEHLRGSLNLENQQQTNSEYSRNSNGSWTGRQQKQPTVEQRQHALYDRRLRNTGGGGEEDGQIDELSKAFQRRNIHSSNDDGSEQEKQGHPGSDKISEASRQREQKRQVIEQTIRGFRGTGLNFTSDEGDRIEMPGLGQEGASRQHEAMAFA